MNASLFDQFYTNPAIAKTCLDYLNQFLKESQRLQYIEPSAGSGSFSSQLTNCIALDIDPKLKTIEKKDFLATRPEELSLLNRKNVCIVGNPPFGKCSSLAVKFFNHSTLFGDSIAFILPRTFKKRSIHKRLNLNYHLVFEWDIPKKSFIYLDEAYDVPCVFQIWERREHQRKIEQLDFNNEWFSFVQKKDAEAAIRRVGGRSGLAYFDFENAAESSHYFIKSKQHNIKDVVLKINSIDFSKIVNSTAGVRSLSKFELLKEFQKLSNEIQTKI
jgi:hypothetical protein